MYAPAWQKLPPERPRPALRLAFAWHAECTLGRQQPRIFAMSGIASISTTSLTPSHTSALSGGKASSSSSLGGGNASGGSSSSSASGDTTTTSFNADGSLTTTTVNAQGQIVSTSTSQATNQAVVASGLATQANADILQGQMPSSLLNMLV
jgi:hypothetical protein